MERSAWPKNLSSRSKREIQELCGQNPEKLRDASDAHSQNGDNPRQPLFAGDLIVSVLGSFSSNTQSLSSGAESYEVLRVPSDAFVSSEVSEGSESIMSPLESVKTPVQRSPVESLEALLLCTNIQHLLQTFIDSTSRYPWTYAIFWQSSFDGDPAAGAPAASSSSPPVPVLGWGDAYYKGEEDKSKGKAKISASSAAEQEHRKRVLRELNSLIVGPSAAAAPDDSFDEEVTDTEWFFLVSMTQSFGNDGSLPGQALYWSAPIWVSDGDLLVDCGCERAKQARIFGLNTMVCVPVIGGVVELGSTEPIYQSPDLLTEVRNLFNFTGGMELGFGGNGNDQGESDPSSLWLNDTAGTVEVKDSAVAGAAAVTGSSDLSRRVRIKRDLAKRRGRWVLAPVLPRGLCRALAMRRFFRSQKKNHGSKSIQFENNHVLSSMGEKPSTIHRNRRSWRLRRR